MLSFFTPQVFPFCCLRVFGDEKVLPWGVTVHVINALASLSHLASTPLSLSLSLSASALARLKSYCLYGRDFRKGAHRSPPNPPCFVCSFFVSCSPIGWDWQERALSRDHSHPRSRPKHKTCFPLTPTSFRWPPTRLSTIPATSLTLFC